MLSRRFFAQLQHVPQYSDSPFGRLEPEYIERRAHRRGIAVVAFVQQQCGASADTQAAARAATHEWLERLQRGDGLRWVQTKCRDDVEATNSVHCHVPSW